MFPYLSQIKNGADIGPKQFEKTFGKTATVELTNCKVTRIVNKDGTISVETAAEQELPLAREGKMRLAKNFSFKFKSAPGSIKISQVKGIEATRPGAPGWVTLLAIDLDLKGSNVVIACRVSKFLFSLTLSETYTLKEIEALGWQLPK